MINSILKNIITISIACSGISLIILLLRKFIGTKVGMWWRIITWTLLVLRLCVPILFSSPVGIVGVDLSRIDTIETNYSYSSIDNPINNVEMQSVVHDSLTGTSSDENFQTEEVAMPIQNVDNNLNIDWHIFINLIYVIGIAMAFIIVIIRIIITNSRLSKLELLSEKSIYELFAQVKSQLNIKKYIPILIDTQDNTPAMCGIIKPYILLPKNALINPNIADLKYIFIHELMHYKNKDVFKLLMLELVTCIHWFNPLFRFIKPIIIQDIELACDEKVLRIINKKSFADYCNVLMGFSNIKKSNYSFVMTNNFVGRARENLKERITMIKNFNTKKVTSFGVILLISLSIALVACTTSVLNEEDSIQENEANVASVDNSSDAEENKFKLSESGNAVEVSSSFDTEVAKTYLSEERANWFIAYINDATLEEIELTEEDVLSFDDSKVIVFMTDENEYYTVFQEKTQTDDDLGSNHFYMIKGYFATGGDASHFTSDAMRFFYGDTFIYTNPVETSQLISQREFAVDGFLHYVQEIIEGNYTIEYILENNEFWYSEKKGGYIITALEYYMQTVDIVLILGDNNLERPFDDSIDIIEIVNSENYSYGYNNQEEVIKNPTIEELEEFIITETTLLDYKYDDQYEAIEKIVYDKYETLGISRDDEVVYNAIKKLLVLDIHKDTLKQDIQKILMDDMGLTKDEILNTPNETLDVSIARTLTGED